MRSLDPDSAYKLLVGAVQPRPIAWVSTVAADGIPNLAPFSFFTVASRNPPTLAVSIGTRDGGGVKDTLANIRATSEFVVNVASVDQHVAVSASSLPVAADVDEFGLAGMTPAPAAQVRPPRVAEAPIALECRLREEIPIGADVVVFGTVVHAYVDDGLLDDGMHVDTGALRPLGRLAGPWYSGPLTAVPQTPAQAVARG